DGEALEVAQRRIAGAEVVDGNAHAQRLQLAQRLDGRLRVLHGVALRDLQLEQARRQAGVGEGVGDVTDEPGLLELPGREVHGDAEARLALLPEPGLGASVPE